MKNKDAVLVVGHGSRREEANADVREAARKIKLRGGFETVEAAFLEIVQPGIRAGIENLYAQGVQSITVFPYFLMPGRHTRGDLPRDVAEAVKDFPDLKVKIAEPLAGHELVIEASIERIGDAGKEFDRKLSLAGRGAVFIVGAGPGDAGLLTLKAHKLLKSCDAVVYDYLVNPEILSFAPPQAERIYVGKIGGGRQTPQAEINRLLIELAKQGKRVVRLKGGDPFVFGRGGEEAEALRDAGVEFEIVPGISSAIAVPAYAGIPLTHRRLARSFAVVTGTVAGNENDDTKNGLNFPSADTLVVLMGVVNLREISRQLIEDGRAAETPVAVVRWGTYDSQEVVTGNLLTIAEETEKARLSAPAIIVVGETVALREKLNWFETSVEKSEFIREIELLAAAA